MSDLQDAFVNQLVSGLQGKTLTTCSRWAEYRRVMGSPFPGPYTFKYHPWCKGIMDSVAPFNTSMKAAQMGITEVAINRAFYTIDILKRDVLYVLPTAINAGDFSSARFNSALLYSDYLSNLFTDTNRINLKQAAGVSLYIRGSRGDSNLKSIPVSTLILDELDEMDQKQIWLALERLSGHIEKSVWAISTPTIPKYGIHRLFQQGTQEHWIFKCPHCSRRTEFIWPDCIEIRGESVEDPDCKESFLKCRECKKQLKQSEKPEFLSTGKWVSDVKDHDPDHRSFYINQLNSFTVSPEDLVRAYFRGLADESAAHEFNNSKLGLPYIGEGAQLNDVLIDQNIKGYTKQDPRPSQGGDRLITMGVDQGNKNYISVMEWFIDTPGRDLNVVASGKLIWEGTRLGSEYEELDKLMYEWQINHCVIDADPEINEARRFARRFPGSVTLSRYREGQVGKEITIQEDELRTPIATVDRTNWIDATLGRFYSQRIDLPRDVSREYREHLKNIVRTYIKDTLGNPQARYVKTGPDHFAHAQTYAEIALPLAASVVRNQPIKAFL